MKALHILLYIAMFYIGTMLGASYSHAAEADADHMITIFIEEMTAARNNCERIVELSTHILLKETVKISMEPHSNTSISKTLRAIIDYRKVMFKKCKGTSK